MDKPHNKFDVWKLSMQLASNIYQVTKMLPATERYSLGSQMRRTAVSVPSNIADGAARRSINEFRLFPSIARGSLSELDTQLDLCVECKMIPETTRLELDSILIRVAKMLYALYQTTKQAAN
jgi:four helix bundle protein